jgi:hypothetical protein
MNFFVNISCAKYFIKIIMKMENTYRNYLLFLCWCVYKGDFGALFPPPKSGKLLNILLKSKSGL